MTGLQHVMIMLGTPLGQGLELLGMIGFALTGALMARDARASWTISLVVTFFIGFGGGILRDFMAMRTPIWAVSHPEAIWAVLLTWVVIILIPESFKIPLWVRGVTVILDTLAIVVFIFSSSFVAVSCQVQPVWFWAPAFSALIAFGGGMMARTLLGHALISPQGHRIGVIMVLLLGSLCVINDISAFLLVSAGIGVFAFLVWLGIHTALQPPS